MRSSFLWISMKVGGSFFDEGSFLVIFFMEARYCLVTDFVFVSFSC